MSTTSHLEMEFVGTAGAAEIIGMSRATVVALIEAGLVDAFRVDGVGQYVIRTSSIYSFLESRGADVDPRLSERGAERVSRAKR